MNIKLKGKYVKISLVAVICMLTFTGCESLDYTEEQEDIIANYAADMLLRHDVNYKYKYISESETTSAALTTTTGSSEVLEETTEYFEENSGISEEGGDVSTVGSDVTSLENIAQAFQLPDGITVDYLGYEITDRYPTEDSQEDLFVMKSVDNYKLLVVKFSFNNTTGNDIAINMMENISKYKGIVNDSKKYNAQLTLLLDALNTYEGTLSAGTSHTFVLIYQTQIDSNDEVNTLSVEVADSSGNETVIKLK
jgi:hypothetical protein